jgi:hypothetical protein
MQVLENARRAGWGAVGAVLAALHPDSLPLDKGLVTRPSRVGLWVMVHNDHVAIYPSSVMICTGNIGRVNHYCW